MHDVDYLLTWNCTHLANSELADPVAELLRGAKLTPPVVCTPETLMGDWK